MKHGLFYTLRVIILIMFWSGTSHAQTLPQQQIRPVYPVQPVPIAPPPPQTGPYYALPSWSQKLPSAARFIILSDWDSAAVLDKETGLVWERSPSTSRFGSTGGYGAYHCKSLALGNRKGWRIPMIYELSSLVDMSVSSGLKLPPGHPFTNVQAETYVSATHEEGQSANWTVDFNTGRVSPTYSANSHIWCVRGPGGK